VTGAEFAARELLATFVVLIDAGNAVAGNALAGNALAGTPIMDGTGAPPFCTRDCSSLKNSRMAGT
jgi:hypothetical protein